MPIRWKISAASTVATMVLIVGAGLIFLTTLRSGLQNTLENSLRSRSDELVSQLDSTGTPTAADGKISLADNTYGQVLSASGAVVESTGDALSAPLISGRSLAKARASSRFFDITLRGSAKNGQELRVLAVPVGTAGTVAVVASSRDVVDEAVERAGKQLLVLGALVLLVAAAGSWLLAGSALKPVDRMRAQAAELQAKDAAGGLDVPPTKDEIGRLGTTLNGLLARLHDALERERAFVADAGHELRTPLTVLRGELELARRPGRSREDLLETVEIASEETERLIRLAEDLLVLARDDAQSSVRWRQFDLAELLLDASSLVESTAATRGVRVEVVASKPLLTNGDPDRLRQAVDNVLSNALKFAPDDSTIRLLGVHQPGSTSVEILDEGIGFAPELVPVVFERFRRGDAARTRTAPGAAGSPSGTGLGLAIVRNILRAHGGDAAVSNRIDRSGARVVLRWPTEDCPAENRDR